MRQNPHVRICGGPGSATTLVYPTVAGHRPPGRRGSRTGHRYDPARDRGTRSDGAGRRRRTRAHPGPGCGCMPEGWMPLAGAGPHPPAGPSPNGRRQRPHARRASRPGRGWDPRDWPRSLAVWHLSCHLYIRYLFAMVRCFRHELLLSRHYLLLTKALRPDFHNRRSRQRQNRL